MNIVQRTQESENQRYSCTKNRASSQQLLWVACPREWWVPRSSKSRHRNRLAYTGFTTEMDWHRAPSRCKYRIETIITSPYRFSKKIHCTVAHGPKLALRGVTSHLVTDMCMYSHAIVGVSPHDNGRAMVGYICPTHTVSVTYKLGVTAAGMIGYAPSPRPTEGKRPIAAIGHARERAT
jgi:hypothetical protein